MRELTTISDRQQASRFGAYLAVQAVESTVEEDDGQWVIWVHNDDDREKSEAMLAEFQQDPTHERYENAERKVRHVLKEADRLRKEAKKKQIDIRERWHGAWWQRFPATYIMIGICVVVSLVCTDWKNIQMSPFGVPRLCNDDESVLLKKLWLFGEPSTVAYFQSLAEEMTRRLVDEDGNVVRQRIEAGQLQLPELSFAEQKQIHAKAALKATTPIFQTGEVWRFITPIFIHLDCIHILFNMMWLRAMGTGIEFVRGSRRFVILCLLLAVFSNFVQLLWSGPGFGGASGVVFGLIGYVWMKGKTQPHLGIGLMQQTVVYSILWLVLCMTGSFGPIANGAHLGGFLLGILIGARQAIWAKLIGVCQAIGEKLPFTK